MTQPTFCAPSTRAFEGRQGDRRVASCAQASLAVSWDREHWVLINAAPDLRAQIIATPALHPQKAPRHSPISDVVLTGAEVDQIAGLLNLRKRESLDIWAAPSVLDQLDANPIFNVLPADVVDRHPVALEIPRLNLLAGSRANCSPSPAKSRFITRRTLRT